MRRGFFKPEVMLLEDRCQPNSLFDSALSAFALPIPFAPAWVGDSSFEDQGSASGAALLFAQLAQRVDGQQAVCRPSVGQASYATQGNTGDGIQTGEYSASPHSVAADQATAMTLLPSDLGSSVQGANACLTESYGGGYINDFGCNVWSGWGASESYGVNSGYMTVSLNPSHPTQVAGVSANFTTRLHYYFPGETITNSATPLSDNSLTVDAYYVFGSSTYVGAEIHVVYNPGPNDPSGANMHWIQVVTDNDSIGPGGGFGVNENILECH